MQVQNFQCPLFRFVIRIVVRFSDVGNFYQCRYVVVGYIEIFEIGQIFGHVVEVHCFNDIPRQTQATETHQSRKVFETAETVIRQIHRIKGISRHTQMLNNRNGQAPQNNLPLPQRIRPLLGGCY